MTAGPHPVYIAELAARLRIASITASTSTRSGHPTSRMSAADLMAMLLARHLHHDPAISGPATIT
jgi:transketolase